METKKVEWQVVIPVCSVVIIMIMGIESLGFISRSHKSIYE